MPWMVCGRVATRPSSIVHASTTTTPFIIEKRHCPCAPAGTPQVSRSNGGSRQLAAVMIPVVTVASIRMTRRISRKTDKVLRIMDRNGKPNQPRRQPGFGWTDETLILGCHQDSSGYRVQIEFGGKGRSASSTVQQHQGQHMPFVWASSGVFAARPTGFGCQGLETA